MNYSNENRGHLIISPHYAPMATGLGHYVTLFHQELKKNKKASVLTSTSSLKESDVYNVVSRWTFLRLYKVFKQNNLFGFETYLIQYVPFMYERRGGINFSFCFFILYLSWFKARKIELMVHEVNYPFEWKPKSLLMFFSHSVMMMILLLSAKKVFVSTEYFKDQLKRFFLVPEKKIMRLSVGSNISYYVIEKTRSSKLKMCMFGKLHPAKEVPWLLESCLEYFRNGLSFELIYIGENEDELLKSFSTSEKEELRKFIRPTGFLSDEKVGEVMQQCDLFLAYFVDGLSSRRGSVMAALQNGLEVISTKGLFTEEEFKDQTFIHLLDLDKEAFKQQLYKLLKTKNTSIPEVEIRDFYENNFSWKKLVKSYVDFSTKDA